MIKCDHLIIGAGIAGIGLKYKLLGKTILVDKNPFKYKIGESHVPPIITSDLGLFSLVSKIEQMKSYTRKLGSVFCDSVSGKYLSANPTPLGETFAFHSERNELEKLLAKELSVSIKREEVQDIDLQENLVRTDKNIYKFDKYILDCSGPAMVIARKLKLAMPIDKFSRMKAKWAYWKILESGRGDSSWANWTVLNRIGSEEWLWQIPIYNGSVLSMGIVRNGDMLSDKEFTEKAENYKADCYKLESLSECDVKKSYMNRIYSRSNYAWMSSKPSGKNWILVGDAYCFADPVYSVGTGVAMTEALCVANHINRNSGRLDNDWYERKCEKLINLIFDGIDTWYNREIFNIDVRRRMNNALLKGQSLNRWLKPTITDKAIELQDQCSTIFKEGASQADSNDFPDKIYYFTKESATSEGKGNRVVVGETKNSDLMIPNKRVGRFLNRKLIGTRQSFCSLYLLCEKYLRNIPDKISFWKFMREIEQCSMGSSSEQQFFHFHTERYNIHDGRLVLGTKERHWVISEQRLIEFFLRLKGEIYSFQEVMDMAVMVFADSSTQLEIVHGILKTAGKHNIFGRNYQFQFSTNQVKFLEGLA